LTGLLAQTVCITDAIAKKRGGEARQREGGSAFRFLIGSRASRFFGFFVACESDGNTIAFALGLWADFWIADRDQW
jgi:hypothetical protein